MDSVDRRQFAAIDTGEHFTGSDIVKMKYGIRKAHPMRMRKIVVSIDALAIVTQAKFSALESRVLTYLCSNMDEGNVVHVNQSVIAVQLDSHQSSVSAAIKRLAAHNLIVKTTGADGRFAVYRVCSKFAWRGADNAALCEAWARDPDILKEVPAPRKKLTDAVKAIGKAAKTPIHMETAAALLERNERQVDRSQEYAQ